MHYLLGDKRPSLKQLYKEVIPQYAAHWREIGIMLGLENDLLNIIHADNPHSVEKRCGIMLVKWLQREPSASWKNLSDAIDEFEGNEVNL